MKKILYIALILCAALGVSCSKDRLEIPSLGSATEGQLYLSLNVQGAATRGYTPGDECDIRFFKKENGEKTLIRHYFSQNELPSSLWLLAGEYSVEVSIGDPETAEAATFDGGNVYYGSADFTITAGETTDVTVNCAIRNTMLKVVFDKSLHDKFDKIGTDAVTGVESRFATTVVVNDEWVGDYKAKGLPYLSYRRQDMTDNGEYEYSRVGYFILPADANKISYCFHAFSKDDTLMGTDPDNSNNPVYGELHMHRTRTLTLPEGVTSREGLQYTLTFKYTPDAEGYIEVDFKIEKADWVEKDDVAGINPAPKPTLEGDGFEIGEPYTVKAEPINYKINYESPIDLIEIYVDNGRTAVATIDLEQTRATVSDNGVEVDSENEGRDVKLTLTTEFFNKLAGGERKVVFRITSGSIEGEVTSILRMSGAYALASTDCWNAKGEISAYVYNEVSDAKIQYRKAGTDAWTAVAATSAGENIYKAAATQINAETTYEYQLLVNDAATGAVAKTTIGTGPQIYNADFENWSGAGTRNSPLCPYLDINTDQWWDSGNEGSKTVGQMLTTNVTDVPKGAKGQYSARLASMSTLGALASGNIFLGKFLGTHSVTKGVVRFGHSFDFTYRPKALKFWYKSEVGKVNVVNNEFNPPISKNDQDVQQIYILLCAMPGPHIVDTGKKETFIDLDSNTKTISYCSTTPITNITTSSKNDVEDAHIIAYGVFEPNTTYADWTEITINLNYNSEYDDEVPTWLMLTASANKYGDFYTGCDTNKMWLDDMELVYNTDNE